MKLKFNIVLATLAAGIVMASCSDSSDWTPGPQDTEIGVSAYFPPQSTYNFIFSSDSDAADREMTVTVKRVNTASAISLPVTLSTSVAGFTAPATVDFEAGQESAEFSISCADIPQGAFQDVTLILPADESDIYGPGVTSLSLSAIISDWDLISDNVTYYYYDGNNAEMYPSTTGEMYYLKGSNMFKVTDFYGSGLDMPFTANTPDQTLFMPTSNLITYADYYPGYEDTYQSWYIYDSATESWPEWTPGGNPNAVGVSYALFYGTTEFSSINMIYDSSTLYGYGSNTIDLQLSDDSYAWGYWQYDFNLKYNPFAATE